MSSTRTLFTADDMRRTLVRLAHEILEQGGAADLALIGIQRRGVDLARRVAGIIESVVGARPPLGELDISLYRDDLSTIGPSPVVHHTRIPFDVDGLRVVLVDDVLYTGRSVRAAIEAILDFGRPRCIQLAVLIDRGHRELPIRPDYIGKNVPTSPDEIINVCVEERDGRDVVEIGPRNHEGTA